MISGKFSLVADDLYSHFILLGIVPDITLIMTFSYRTENETRRIGYKNNRTTMTT